MRGASRLSLGRTGGTVTGGRAEPGRQAELDAARLVLARLGITPDQLVAHCTDNVRARPSMPTFDEYIAQVSEVVSAGTFRVYDSYWRRIRRVWGERRLDEPTPSEIRQLAQRTRDTARVRSNSRGGRNAAEHLIAALRCLYRHAVADGLFTEAENPALRVPKPRRLPTTRRALLDDNLAELFAVA